jgi:hypothetical protein
VRWVSYCCGFATVRLTASAFAASRSDGHRRP